MTYKSRDIMVAPVGTKVRLLPDATKEHFKREVDLGFDKILTVRKVVVDMYRSEVSFEEVAGWYNTCAFEPLKEFKPIGEEEWAERFPYYGQV
jgi:hypothetical protein